MSENPAPKSADFHDLDVAFGGAAPKFTAGALFAATIIISRATFQVQGANPSFPLAAREVLDQFVSQLSQALNASLLENFSFLTIVWLLGAYVFIEAVIAASRLAKWFGDIDVHESRVWAFFFRGWAGRVCAVILAPAVWPLLAILLLRRSLLVRETVDDNLEDDQLELGVFATKSSERGSAVVAGTYLCDLAKVSAIRVVTTLATVGLAIWLSWFVALL